MKPKKGFTLIELLVVIAIIGILATIAVISLYNARTKARDAKRVADVKQMQTALELFYNDKDRYPTLAEWSAGSIFSTSTEGNVTYMLNIPAASNPPDGSCDTASNTFVYSVSSNGNSYTISYCIGGKTGDLVAGPKCATKDGIVQSSCVLSPMQTRNNQRLADIQIIKNALAAMYSANGYYFVNGNSTYFTYRGKSLVGGSERQTNCSTVTSEPNNTSGTYGSSVPCPTQSDWCMKLGADLNDVNSSSGTNCDTGTVYLRHIPLNNHLPVGTWTTGLRQYEIFGINNFNTGGDDFLRVKYRLEGSATGEYQSDHFLNGAVANCHYDSEVTNGVSCQ